MKDWRSGASVCLASERPGVQSLIPPNERRKKGRKEGKKKEKKNVAVILKNRRAAWKNGPFWDELM
jgi:hypothetical protein